MHQTGRAIPDAGYTKAVPHLSTALAERGVDESVVKQVVERIGMTRAAIVEGRWRPRIPENPNQVKKQLASACRTVL